MNRNTEYYMSLPYRTELVRDPENGSYVASCPELPGCLTSGKTADEAIANLEDAKRTWITGALEDGNPIPSPDYYTEYSGQIRLRIPKSLHRSISENARREGVSMNQYCIMQLTTACRCSESVLARKEMKA